MKISFRGRNILTASEKERTRNDLYRVYGSKAFQCVQCRPMTQFGRVLETEYHGHRSNQTSNHTQHYMELESTLIKMKETYLIFIYFINSHIC